MSNKKKKPDDDKKYKRMRTLANARNQKYRSSLTDEQKEEKKRKDRERYHKKKALNEIKSIKDKSDREKRKQRKIWRKNSFSYRQRKKSALTLPEDANQLDSTEGSILETNRPIENRESHQKKRGRREVRRKKAKVYRDNQKKAEQIKVLNRTVERLRKKLYRERKKTLGSPSPNKKIDNLLNGKRVPQLVRRQLLFGYAVKKQLEFSTKNINPRSKKQQTVAKLIGSNILRKYRVQNMLTKVVPYKLNRVININTDFEEYTRKQRIYVMTPEVQKTLENFFEDDRISKMLPGKRDYVKRNGVKKQTRVLLSSLERLHSRFQKETNIVMSYRNFCRWKPFWIRKPKEIDRETCACVIHANVELLINKLVQTNSFKSPQNVDYFLDEICCLSSQKVCMLGQCVLCSNINFEYEITDDKLITFHQWKAIEEVRTIKGKQTKIKRTIKQSRLGKISEVVSLLKDLAPKFKKHVYYQTHQANALYEKKKNLTRREAVVHIDFSENYVAKFSQEIQAMHFGASKRQISLHTGVFYFEGNTQSFCTVSDNLEHKAHGVWAHLEPILSNFPNKEEVEKLHFWSDGPSSQYRNRYNLRFLEKLIPTVFENIKYVTWNFNEAGHGKGAMDGVGGTIKRQADDLVRKGADITNAADLVSLNEYFPKILIHEIKEETFIKYKSQLNSKTPPVSQIMKVHQCTMGFENKKTINKDYRHLSCFKCVGRCKHWSLAKVVDEKPTEYINDTILYDKIEECGNGNNVDERDIPFQTLEPDLSERPSPGDIQGGVFVLVKVDSINKSAGSHRFVAVCEGPIDDDGQVEIIYLKRVSKDKKCFKAPDNHVYMAHYSDIINILPFPDLKLSGDRVTYQFDTDIDVFDN